ncbi:MAG TPA: endonuclease/exonuclease/phosphatase family protein, partial [Planctomycetaceae bacterium]|nr:endonuclease/exonuclease/phosphatase family protein [Planctomycetaceae bacterium]
LTTVRWGLAKLLGDPGDSHSRIEVFQQHEAGRLEEARQTRRWVDEVAGARALLGGDFNATPQCKLYDSNWRDFHNTFEEAGIGYGYTARCDDPAYWPANTPWVRIDHIVHGSEWRCVRTGRGQTAGSDHRFIWADVVRVSSE